MQTRRGQDSFPTGILLASLLGTTAGLFLLGWWAFPRLFADAEAARACLLLGAGTVGLLAVLGVAPLAVMGPLGSMPTVYAWFIGTGIRMVGVVLALAVGVKLLDLPPLPLVTAIMGIYLPLLAIEAAVAGHYLWIKDRSGGADQRPAKHSEALA